MKLVYILVFGFALISNSYALNVTQCSTVDEPIEGLNDNVKIGNCKKPPCRLRKNSVINLEFKFTPTTSVEKVTNSVFAYIAGIPFPFPGVDSTDACNNIYTTDGKEKASCPLKSGQEYLYKNSIDVLQVYPRLKVIVHWALTKPGNKDLICFEVPARITN